MDNFDAKNKTAVLLITTHGGIEVEFTETNDLIPNTFEAPQGMDIVILQAAACGVVNITDEKEINDFIPSIRSISKKFNNSTSNEDMIKIVEEIKKNLIMKDGVPKYISNEIHSKNSYYANNKHAVNYDHHTDKSYKIYSGSKILNKRLTRTNNEISEDTQDWKVIMLDYNPKHEDTDLMDVLHKNITRYQATKTVFLYTENIINYLGSIGITKVIIIDLTCSAIIDDITERQTRYIRRKYEGGKYTKRKKNKKKTKKNKNKKKQKKTNKKKMYEIS
jgi:hypothetical protein